MSDTPKPGRPVGTGHYGENTKVMRIPESAVTDVREFLARRAQPTFAPEHALPPGVDIWKAHPHPSVVKRPLASHKVQAGFPSPADDYIEKFLDLNEFLVDDANSTFFYKVGGFSMKDVGIFPGDTLVVSRLVTPMDDDIVIAILDGELTVKRLRLNKLGVAHSLVAENKEFKPIVIREGQELLIWGVVLHAIHSFRKLNS